MSADNFSACDKWKQSIYEGKALTDGWTQMVNENFPTYSDTDGNEISDWTSYEGYSTSECPELVDSNFSSFEEIVCRGAVAILSIITIAFCVRCIFLKCSGQWDSDSDVKDEYWRESEPEVQDDLEKQQDQDYFKPPSQAQINQPHP